MTTQLTYTNPIYGTYFADPFVLKYNGEYYAYGTFPIGECRIPILHSRDLLTWDFVGDALKPTEGTFECYWAPEVAYYDGTFYMYYSAGGQEGEGHQLRVATASEPSGPFKDLDVVLAPDIPFTIDAHPFRDDDGTWYLFYSLDFTDGSRPGTSIVVDRLVGMTSLAGEQQTVVRPHAEWNVFQRQRQWLGRVWDWYTIEGAFMLKHDGRYYCFYSGGAWREPNYGVGAVVADHPLGPYAIETSLESPEVLRTIPNRVIGPGHISVAPGPDNLHPYMFYHAWNSTHDARLMRMDPLVWTEQGPVCLGPSTEPQPMPPMPLFRELFDDADASQLNARAWQVQGGAWRVQHGQAIQESSEQQHSLALLLVDPPDDFLLEVNTKQAGPGGTGAFGLLLAYQDDDNYTELAFDGERGKLVWSSVADGSTTLQEMLDGTGENMRLDAYHQVLVKHDHGHVEVRLDGVLVGEHLRLEQGNGRIALSTRSTAAAFDGIALTSLVKTS